MKKLLLLLCLVAIACSPKTRYTIFSMTQPRRSVAMHYNDQTISVQFAIRKAYLRGVEGTKQYEQYNGLIIALQNKTDEILTVDWNKVSFVDWHGSPGNPVMHGGVKYEECSEPKAPTRIPPRGRLSDVIIPCYAIEQRVGAGWHASLLPSPRVKPEADFGLFLPLQIGSKTKNYKFMFRAASE